MSNATKPQSALAASTVGGEASLKIRPGGRTVWTGTRAQIEGEGLVPSNMTWPKGFDIVRWTQGRLHWELCRYSPGNVGIKKRQLWAETDLWELESYVPAKVQRDPVAALILEKTAELKAALRQAEPAAVKAQEKFSAFYWAARYDKAFQAFKGELAPQLARRRRPKKSSSPPIQHQDLAPGKSSPPSAEH